MRCKQRARALPRSRRLLLPTLNVSSSARRGPLLGSSPVAAASAARLLEDFFPSRAPDDERARTRTCAAAGASARDPPNRRSTPTLVARCRGAAFDGAEGSSPRPRGKAASMIYYVKVAGFLRKHAHAMPAPRPPVQSRRRASPHTHTWPAAHPALSSLLTLLWRTSVTQRTGASCARG